MKYTVSLRPNREFRRMYARGKSAATPVLVAYCRKNRFGKSRLGITVSAKIGNAVVRNKVRRRIKEAYRTNENLFFDGYDIVFVARVRAAAAGYDAIVKALMKLAADLKFIKT